MKNAVAVMHRAPASIGTPRRGLASLVVVMVLFFIVSLLAAYTNRNLIFEQKTSANQYRSTQAFEAADAGMEWALAMLNGSGIDDSCIAAAAPAKSFAQRYVNIALSSDPLLSANNGLVTPTVRTSTRWPTCVFNGTALNCACPDNANVDADPATAAGPNPAFRIWLAPADLASGKGVFGITSVGCTRLPRTASDRCLEYTPDAELGEGVARHQALIALRSALAVPPSTALTVRGNFNPDAGAARLRVVNVDAVSGGFTVISGGNISPSDQIAAETLPGTPGEISIVANDARLLGLSTRAIATVANPVPLTAAERMFVATFGMRRQVFRDQPGLRLCSPCSATRINELLGSEPGRVIWVDGDLTLDAPVGNAATLAPVLLVVNGTTLTLGDAGAVYGFVYITGGAAAGTATIKLPNTATSLRGALVAENGLATAYDAVPAPTSQLTITYDRDALDRLRWTTGSWVRVGGSWRDFRSP
jgi:Tfp pilus assembly protein PilX